MKTHRISDNIEYLIYLKVEKNAFGKRIVSDQIP